MIDAFASAILQISQPAILIIILTSILIGIVVGLTPGLGGLSALAIMIPFVYGMEPLPGMAFLLAAHAVIATGGSITAILLGIPGSIHNAATVTDGFRFSRRGRAGYALGAALSASAIGGIIGVIVLISLLPILKSIVYLFGSAETFCLALAGIILIGALGDKHPVKGITMGALGLFLASFGYDRISGIPRFWFEIDYLLDGIRLVPLALGLFAIPEILELMNSGQSISSKDKLKKLSYRELMSGAGEILKRKVLTIRSSVIGVIVGLVPGIGGEVAPFVAYAAGKDRNNCTATEDNEITGVIAPEASNNAKEGGALVPTLAFGIPGSAGMSLLLGGMLVLGIEVGPQFLENHMDVAIGLGLIVAIANLVAAVIIFIFAPLLIQITRINGHVLAPVLLMLVLIGVYVSANNVTDVVTLFVFGIIGLVMKSHHYSRPALLLGFVLGGAVETYLHISINALGGLFFTGPVSLVILGLTVTTIVWVVSKRTRS